jgi:tricorn protease
MGLSFTVSGESKAMKRLAPSLFLPVVLTIFLSVGYGKTLPKLFLDPTLSTTSIAFAYGGLIWVVPRQGGVAHPLITGHGNLRRPLYSPNGRYIAFTATYQGNTDVYVARADGADARRLTYYPSPNIAVGWTANSRDVLFRSDRYGPHYIPRLFLVSRRGGFAQPLPLPTGQVGSFSPHDHEIAYVPELQWERFWQHYEGGQKTTIRIAQLGTSRILARIPHGPAEDRDPLWIGNHIFFLSNAAGQFTLYSYNIRTHHLRERLPASRHHFDMLSAASGPGGIVLDRFGRIELYNLHTQRVRAIPIRLEGNIPDLRSRFVKAQPYLQNSAIDPRGDWVAFTAYGKLLELSVQHKGMVTLTHDAGEMVRDPAWSPHGTRIAYFSDKSGAYALYVRKADGIGPVRVFSLGSRYDFYRHLRWSPVGNRLLYADVRLHLYEINLKKHHPHPRLVATDIYDSTAQHFDARWSPNGRWIVYTRLEPNFRHAIALYSVRRHTNHMVTHGSSDCRDPVFSPHGRYLYFTVSTDLGLSATTLDMTGLDHRIRRSVYALALGQRTPSPIPERVQFPGLGNKNASGTKKLSDIVEPRIDLDHLRDRLVALPVPPANYVGLEPLPGNRLILLRAAPIPPLSSPAVFSVLRYNLIKRKETVLVMKARVFHAARDGKSMLVAVGQKWYVDSTIGKFTRRPIPTGSMMVRVVPQLAWSEMYQDIWRMEHTYFYSPIFDGTPIDRVAKVFERYLPGVGSRHGLNILFREMLSYLAVGHMFVRGGMKPHTLHVGVGLLGARYRIKHGRYQIARILRGGEWNPSLYAPLAQPGLNIHRGDYVLAVNGHQIRAGKSLYAAFQGLANKDVLLTVAKNANGAGARNLVVHTISNEAPLNLAAWVDHNIRVVNRMSHGQLGYVYLPNTYSAGLRYFNRYFFSQINKRGVIIDERFNTGGDLADYIIQYLQRRPMALHVNRYGRTYVEPSQVMQGPKVMIINRYSGSGGDALPWFFKMAHLGPLVGTRTWGGLVGIWGYPPLMDGGSVTAPREAIEGLNGHFPVEDHGIAPTVRIWNNPALVRKGIDPQLVEAVHLALRMLREHPIPRYHREPYRNYHLQIPHVSGVVLH